MSATRKYSLEGSVASVLFIVLFIVVLVQVFGRTPLFHGPVWTEEVARWLWVWMAFFAIGEVERGDTQLRMGFLAEMLSDKMRALLYSAIDLVYLGIMAHLSWIGYKTVLRTWRNESVTLPTSDAVLYASAFVGSFFILYRISRRLLTRFKTDFNAEQGK